MKPIFGTQLLKTWNYLWLKLLQAFNSFTVLDHFEGGVCCFHSQLHLGKSWRHYSSLSPWGGNTIFDFSHQGQSPNLLLQCSLEEACSPAICTSGWFPSSWALCQLILASTCSPSLVWLLHRYDKVCIPVFCSRSCQIVCLEIHLTSQPCTLFYLHFTMCFPCFWLWHFPFPIPFRGSAQ